MSQNLQALGNEQEVRLIGFGGGLSKHHEAAARITSQARQFSQIHSIKNYSEADLPDKYFELFNDFPVRFPKGYGLWSWKPFLIHQELQNLNLNDILIYVDAGCELNPQGSPKLDFYLSETSKHEVLLFELNLPNRYWSKNHPLLTGNTKHFFRNHIMGTVLFIKNTERTQKFIKHWLDLCSANDGELLRDPHTNDPQISGFQLHRHDQSCLSIAAYEEGFKTIPDTTYYEYWPDGKAEPILALRNISGISKLKNQLYPNTIKRIKHKIKLTFYT